MKVNDIQFIEKMLESTSIYGGTSAFADASSFTSTMPDVASADFSVAVQATGDRTSARGSGRVSAQTTGTSARSTSRSTARATSRTADGRTIVRTISRDISRSISRF